MRSCVFVVLLVFTSAAIAESLPKNPPPVSLPDIFPRPKPPPRGKEGFHMRGCCSHHDGVAQRCGPDGRAICKDGTVSTTRCGNGC
jgi:hypothetical protein